MTGFDFTKIKKKKLQKQHVWWSLLSISGVKIISNVKFSMTKYLIKCHQNLIK